jgi:hypothetical protein
VAPTTSIAGTPAKTGDHVVPTHVVTAGSTHEMSPAPRINRRVPTPLRSKIEAGFRLALERVDRLPACAGLFAELGTDGIEMLSTTLYYRAELKMEMRVCTHAYAYTLVGGAPTWLCRRFSWLSDERAAAVLLHEALHHAGTDEWPHDPHAASGSAINELVSNACEF